MKNFISNHYPDFIQISLCILGLMLFAFAANAGEKIYQCTQVELTDKVTLRSTGGDKRFITDSGKEISKVDAIKILLADKK